MQLKPTFCLFVLFHVPLTIGQRRHELHSHIHSFPPEAEEYDPLVFDPSTIFGAPYGGYARATRSRLAALPLRLVGDATAELFTLGFQDDMSRAVATSDRGMSEAGEKNVLPPLHFTVRDGQGRPFVCRIYHEDGLESDSITGSMFDAAHEKPPLTTSKTTSDGVISPFERNDKNTNINSVRTTAKSAKNSSSDRGAAYLTNGADKDKALAVQKVTDEALLLPSDPTKSLKPNSMTSAGASFSKTTHATSLPIEKTTETSTATSPNKIKLRQLKSQIDKLKGVCAQLHTGWWSYEWCHEQKVSQFHINFLSPEPSDDEGQATKTSGGAEGQTLIVESVTTIGNYASRRISLNDSTEEDNYDQDNQKVHAGVVLVTDTFRNGDWCEEASTHRTMEVQIKCCHENYLKLTQRPSEGATNSFVEGTTADYDIPLAALLSVTENKVCKYTAKMCTPLLCTKAFMVDDTPSETGSSNIGRRKDKIVHRPQPGISQPLFSNEALSTNDITLPSTNENENTISVMRENSIRSILEWTLGTGCVRKETGWWTYEFCYMKHVRQIHEDYVSDELTGLTKKVVKAEHILGNYDPETEDLYPKEEEIDHIVMPEDDLTSSLVGITGGRSDGSKSRKFIPTSTTTTGSNSDGSSSTASLGGNGAFFVQEYLHGDICNTVDVTDSAIKGGTIGDGSIERATTVRFSCGKYVELVRVNEDSTCHYVVDVTVPELCKHQFFEAPVVKTHVVKCLPIP